MKRILFVAAAVAPFWIAAFAAPAQAAPCLMVTLTGTQGGPSAFKGLAGPGTLVRYGDDAHDCSTLKLQFDTGRGTVMRLSELGISPEQLNAVFFTHMHNDHGQQPAPAAGMAALRSGLILIVLRHERARLAR
jgi:ribonuclease Z